MKVKVTGTPNMKIGLMPIGEEGNVKTLSDNPFGSPTFQFNGPSHDEGGIPISFQGKEVEVEGGETGFENSDGSFTVMGNLKIPGTRKTFKQAGKEIAEKEQRATKYKDKAISMAEDVDLSKPFDALRFSSSRVITDAATQRFKMAATEKEALGNMQNIMLEMADATGRDVEDISKAFKAQKGKRVYKPGAKTDNLDDTYKKFLDFLSEQGIDMRVTSGTDSHSRGFHPIGKAFDATPIDTGNKQSWEQWHKQLQSPEVQKYMEDNGIQLINEAPIVGGKLSGRATGNHFHFQPVAGVRTAIPKATDLFSAPPQAGVQLPQPQLFDENVPVGVSGIPAPSPSIAAVEPSQGAMKWASAQEGAAQSLEGELPYNLVPNNQQQSRMSSLADRNRVGLMDIMPEIAALFEKPQPVPHQRYNPELLNPYNVSFQDRLNQNASTFRAIEQNLSNNPAALSVLAGQKYNADSQVLAEQFRVNQGIENQVANQNNQILNQAQMVNLELQDKQAVRQEQARTNTKQHQRQAMVSLSNKFIQNRQENNNIRLLENMSGYRPDENFAMQWMGGSHTFSDGMGNLGAVQPRTITTTKQGDTTTKTIVDPTEQQLELLKIQRQNMMMRQQLGKLLYSNKRG